MRTVVKVLLSSAILAGGVHVADAFRAILPITSPVVVDGIRFEGIPSGETVEELLEAARNFVESGRPISRTAAQGGLRKHSAGDRLVPKHTISIGEGRGIRTIVTGSTSGPLRRDDFPPGEGWSYRAPGTGKEVGIATSATEGRRTIVIVDPVKGTFLQIAEVGG